MNFEASFFLYTLIAFITISTISVMLMKRHRMMTCSCEICHSYLTLSWSRQHNNLCDWYSHLLAKSPNGTIHVHVLNNVITANPDCVEHILKTKFDNYPKGKQFQDLLGDLLGKGIFNVDGDLWKFQRKIASFELGSVSVRSYAFEIVTSEIRSSLIPFLLQETQTVDLQQVFRRFSFDTICRFSFGLDPTKCFSNLSKPISDFAQSFDLASNLSAQRAACASPWIWKMNRLFKSGSEKPLREAIIQVNKLAEEIIKFKRLNSDVSDVDGQDLLSRFMTTINDDRFLRDIVVSFLLAGRDTVASGLTAFFWLLSRNPRVIDLIRQESDMIMGKENGGEHVSFRQLKEMQYLNAAVHESLRLFPPVQFDSKFCQNDDVLPDGTFVAKDSRVTYHPYAMGRMERIWGSDCLEFKPERWLKDGVFVRSCPFKFPVFHAGPRVCLGREMAVVEMKAVAVSLVRRFNFELAIPIDAPRFVPGLTATLKDGLQVAVRRNC